MNALDLMVPNPEVERRARALALLLLDVDGVLTDGSLYLSDDGQEYKAFHSRDGHGMVMLQNTGVRIGIITGRSSEVVRRRMEALGVQHVHQGARDKLGVYQKLRAELGLADEQIGFVGDDIVDLAVMRRVGLAVAVQDAHPLVKRHAHWHTRHPGGRGAVREVCEIIMAAQGTLSGVLETYL